MVRQLVGPTVQLGIRQPLTFVLHRHRVRRPLHLRFEQLRERLLSRVLHARPTPLHQPPLVFGVHQRQVHQPLLRPRYRGLQQHPQVPQQPLHRLWLEQVAVVVDDDRDTGLVIFHQQRQVELRGPLLRIHPLERQAAQLHLGARGVLQRQRHLDERTSAQVPLGLELLHQLLEGHVLVRIRPQRHLFHLREQLAEGLGEFEPRPQHQRVDEEADEALRLRARAASDGRAHAHVLLPRVSPQHRLERRQQHHEGRHALAPPERLHVMPQRLRPQRVPVLATEALHRRTWLVRGQLQRPRRALELLLPVRHLSFQHLALQPLALPDRVVRVLHGQLGQRRLTPLRMGLVQRRHLAHEDAHGPAVGHDVVHHQHQHVLLLRQPHQRRPQQRALSQRERAPGLLLDQAHCLLVVFGHGQRAQVHHGQWHPSVRHDDLHGRAAVGAERGAQGLVTAHQCLEAPLQGQEVELSRQPHRHGDVVERAARLQLVQEPQALLREGQWECRVPRHTAQGRCLQPGTLLLRADHLPRQLLHRGGLEDVPQRQLHAEHLAYAGDQLCRQQRVAPQLEEVALHADLLDVQHLREDGRQLLLRLRARADELLVLRSCRLGRRQRLAVHLAVGRQGQRVQHEVGGRHHVLWQQQPQVRAQGGGLQRRASLRRHVRHQSPAFGAVLPGHHDGLADALVLRQRGLHLAQLDAEAPHLHLSISPTDELQRPVCLPAHHVARAVEALAVSEGTGHEALRRQLRPAHVPTGQALASHVQLARHPRRQRLHRPVQHVRGRVGYRPADGHRGAPLPLLLHPVAHRERRVLRGAVPVDEHDARREPLADTTDGQHITPGQHLLHPGQGLRLPRLHLLEERRRQPQRGDAGTLKRPAQLLQRGHTRRVHHQLRPMQQRAPQLQRRRVEGDGRQLQPHLLRPEVRVVRSQHQP